MTDSPPVIVAPPFNPDTAALNFAVRLLRQHHDDYELRHTHLSATDDDLPAIREALERLADRLAAGMVLPEPTETRTEWGVWWHADDPDSIRMDADKLPRRSRAEEVAKERIGQYGITGYTIVKCEHRRFADGSTWISDWERVETVMPS